MCTTCSQVSTLLTLLFKNVLIYPDYLERRQRSTSRGQKSSSSLVTGGSTGYGKPSTVTSPRLDARGATCDYVLIDCPPSLGLLTLNGLVAAREVLLPIQCEYYALEGLSQLLRTLDMVSSHLNPDLRVSAIVLTMYDGRTRLASQVVHEVRTHFGERVWTPWFLAPFVSRKLRPTGKRC